MPDGVLHAVFLRSQHAHAVIVRIDAEAARAMPGVVAVITAEDLARDGIGPLKGTVNFTRADGSPALVTHRPLLAGERVRHVGEALAMVIAENVALAADAAEAIVAEIEDQSAVAVSSAALAPDATIVWEEAPDNIGFVWTGGDPERAADAFGNASHIVRLKSAISRVTAAPIEPRKALAMPLPDGRLELRTGSQNPFVLKAMAEKALKLESGRLRVLVGDVGGSFGMKGGAYADDLLLIHAARTLDRPVAWRSDRTEAFLTDNQGRDVEVDARLGLDEDGRFVALDVSYRLNVGAYLSNRSLGAINNIGGLAGMYRIGAIATRATGVMTHTVPVAPYRGAGRPEATYVIERLIDLAARQTGIDPIELRRRNLVTPDAMPYATGLTFTYDVGDFPGIMQAAIDRADFSGFAERREASDAKGLLRGLGIANPIEVAAGPVRQLKPDHARIILRADGDLELVAGVLSTGQGQETVLTRLVAEQLGLPVEQVHFRQGDTDALAEGRGAGGSSGAPTGAPAVLAAGDAFIEAAREAAADALEADAADIDYAGGRLRIAGTDREITLADLARQREHEPIVADASFLPSYPTFPNGCHIAEVEIDPETGQLRVDRYTAVEDIGHVLDPGAGRRPDAWRHRAGARPGGRRGDRLRRECPDADLVLRRLFHAAGRGHALDSAFDSGRSVAGQSAGDERRRRGGNGREALPRFPMRSPTRWRRSASTMSRCRRRRSGCGRPSRRRAAAVGTRCVSGRVSCPSRQAVTMP
jgi:carbon-monoxide dehydrogenase large subunit